VDKWIWLAIEGLHREEEILGAFNSKEEAMQYMATLCKGVKLKWRELDNGDFYAQSHGYDYYARQILFDDRD